MADMDPLTFALQALLMRHEAYIADSENERKDMAAQIESLAADKQSLEKRNADFVVENRSLLDQLETLNTAVAESDAHVANLQATLTSTQQEMQRLAQLASRTESLERQLAEFEQEQAIWQSKMEEKELSERSALRRWQTAERTLAQIQDQIEQIEREAKEERERHAEIVGRMERRRVVEQELGSAAGRLKSAAALKNADRDASNGVVSHFVKDILQDNANLQTGIVELREMLNNSNEEVENLRNQLLLHQPTDESEDVPLPNAERKDLGLEMNRAKSQELHVHHHYHAPPAAPKAPPLRRPKKKRYSVYSTGQYTPSSGTSTPRSSVSYNTPNSAAAILQQTAASVPPSAGGKRWSMQSAATYHSILASPGPSSPSNRTSSVYERVFSDFGQDSSRPTTPDTDEPGSPLLAPMHSWKNSASWSRTYSAPVALRHGFKSSAAIPSLDSIMSMEELPKIAPPPTQEDPIPEESERDDDNNNEPEWQEDELSSAEEPHSNTPPPISTIAIHHQPFQPSLRRAASHESLLSVSGMDIHTLKSRPSQLLAPYANRALTSQAVISDTTAHATRPVPLTSRSSTAATGRSLLSGMASEQRQQAAAAAASRPAAAAGLGKKVGGWVFGRWGATPAPSTTAATTTMKTGGEVRAVGGAAVKGKATSADVGSTGAAGAKGKAIDVSGTTAAATSKTRATSAEERSVSSTTAAKGKADVGSAGTAAAVPKGKPMRVVSDGAIAAGEKSAPTMPKIPKVRSPGINQSGPLLGFFEEVRTLPAAPVLKSLDEEALRDVLGE